MNDCRIEIAGVPVLVRCCHQENADFFRDYRKEGQEECLIVEPTQADLERIQADFDRADEAEGIPKHRRTDSFLENNAIHALLSEKLVDYSVLLMHGSALCMDQDAYIFTAKSGTGKSTHARLWREVFGERVWMINDDKPMLKIGRQGAAVYGSPWRGKHRLGTNASAPLRAIVQLERGDVNHIEPMSKADAFPVLMKQSLRAGSPGTRIKILELEKRLLDSTDFYRLTCNLEPEAAAVAWKGMNEGIFR